VKHKQSLLKEKKGIFATVLSVLMATMLLGTASAAVVNIDGVYNAGDDGYNKMTIVEFFNDHHSQFDPNDPGNTGTMRWIDHADGLYVYGEVPLKAKNNIWGNGVTPEELALYYEGWCDAPAAGQSCTHHNKDGVGGDPTSGSEPLVLDFERATGSEKFVVAATNLKSDGKAEGGITVDFGVSNDADTKTSVDWVIANEGNEPGKCDTTNCNEYDIPMSFETLFTGNDATQVLGWLQGWDAYNADNNNSKPVGLVAHLSPERGGVTSVVPVPAAFWLFGTALIGFIGISRRTNLA